VRLSQPPHTEFEPGKFAESDPPGIENHYWTLARNQIVEHQLNALGLPLFKRATPFFFYRLMSLLIHPVFLWVPLAYFIDRIHPNQQRYRKLIYKETGRRLSWRRPLAAMDAAMTRIALARRLAWNMVVWGRKPADAAMAAPARSAPTPPHSET
jgi:hypothetical protein